MKHVTLFAFGSWGDVRPLVVLGKGLKESGHAVQMVASAGYEDWISDHGLDFYPLTDDVTKLFKDLSSTDVYSPIQQIRIVRAVLPPIFTRMGLDVLAATRNSDVLLTVEFSLSVLMSVLELNQLKTILINPAPLTPSEEIPSAASPKMPGWFPSRKLFNRLSYRFGQGASWSLLASPRKSLEKQLGTPKKTFADYRDLVQSTPTLTTVSPLVVPRPADWEAHQQMTGYLFDDEADWNPPQDLVDFIAAGEPPVYIGFGSMVDHKPEKTTRLIIEAARRAGKRAVIQSGWAGLGLDDLKEDVYLLNYAPHYWLFPQMAAVVHHGGAGTTAAGFRAGIPTVIIPHNADQPYWGRLVSRMGVGAEPIPRRKLNADKLAHAIRIAAENGSIRQQARELGENIKREEGLAESVKWVEKFLTSNMDHS